MNERYQVVRARTKADLYFSYDIELNFPTSPAVSRERAEEYCKEDQQRDADYMLS